LFLSTRNDSVEFRARHGFDVYAHGPATSPVVTLSFWDAEAEIVLVSAVGRNAHLEYTEAFRAWIRDFKVIVGILDAFESLLLAKDQLIADWTVEVYWKGILEAEFKLAVRLDNRCFGGLDQVALLRNVLIRNVVSACLAHAANFSHVGVSDKVDVTANWWKVGRNFEVFTVLGR